MAAITHLTDESTGRYLLTTESESRYVLDLDGRTLRREQSPSNTESVTMRRDTEEVHLVRVAHLAVGSPAVLLIDLSVPGVAVTRRTTTPVAAIDRV